MLPLEKFSQISLVFFQCTKASKKSVQHDRRHKSEAKNKFPIYEDPKEVQKPVTVSSEMSTQTEHTLCSCGCHGKEGVHGDSPTNEKERDEIAYRLMVQGWWLLHSELCNFN